MKIIPKINLSKSIGWDHHRSGWSFCVNCLAPLHNPNGILFIDSVEQLIKSNRIINKPWIGFVHNAPYHPSIMKLLYGDFHGGFDLNKMINCSCWNDNIKKCLGLFCLSSDVYYFLKSHVDIPIKVVYHTTEFPEIKFEWDKFLSNKDKKIFFIGHWMRNWQYFFDINPPKNFKKIILKGVGNCFNYLSLNHFNQNSTVEYFERVDNEEYDNLLSENIVFLNLFGSSANNVVVECIARNTPVILNRMPSTEEYLGKNYPLFYENLDQAEKLFDLDLLKESVRYLKEREDIISPSRFLSSVYDSEIYQSISLARLL